MDQITKNCIYEEIMHHLDACHELLLATVINGPHLGEQLLCSDDTLWYYKPDKSDLFLQRALPQLLESKHTVSLTIEEETILLERIGKKPSLVICGGGHVAMEVLHAASRLNFSVTVIDDRILFADHARQANADHVFCDSFDHALEQIPGGYDTYFVIVTRGHRYDKECLRKIFQKSYAYVGMMGSRGRIAHLKKELLEEGFPPELLADLKAPIGLPIGAETPTEIAVSILAELIQTKSQCRKNTIIDTEVMNALVNRSSDVVLCTIIDKHGSAPRAVGTRMLVFSDRSVVGTIGGGCVEADVISQAVELFRENDKNRCIHVSMPITDAEDQGLVCGGTISILLQKY